MTLVELLLSDQPETKCSTPENSAALIRVLSVLTDLLGLVGAGSALEPHCSS